MSECQNAKMQRISIFSLLKGSLKNVSCIFNFFIKLYHRRKNFPKSIAFLAAGGMESLNLINTPRFFIDIITIIWKAKWCIFCFLYTGLGRTGVLIACYLIYSLRVRASDVIRFVRMKRPGAIQTRGQIQCIQEFEHSILPQMIVFPMGNNVPNRRPVSLESYLRRQSNVLHGYEQRTFKHIPKVKYFKLISLIQFDENLLSKKQTTM